MKKRSLVGMVMMMVLLMAFGLTAYAEDITEPPIAIPEGEATIVSHTQEQEGEIVETIPAEEQESFKNEKEVVKTEEGQEVKTKVEVNAIQEAVNTALGKVTEESKQVIVEVDNGVYNGDIKINTVKPVDKDFILYILTKDSYTLDTEGKLVVTAEGSGNATVNGNLTIEGIDVVLAGIYLTLNNTLTAKDASVTWHGSQRADNMTAVLDAEAEITIHGGKGDDNIVLKGRGTATDTSGKSGVIYGDEGNDAITVDVTAGGVISEIQVDGGAGNANKVHFTGALNKNSTPVVDVQGEWTNFTLDNKDGKKITVKTTEIAQYTDELTEKPVVKVNSSNITDNKYTMNAAFTDYEYETASVALLTILTGGFDSYFTNFIIKSGDRLDIGSIIAEGINLILMAKQIIISGLVKAKNIIAKAEDDDTQFSISAPKNVITEKVGIDGAQYDVSFFDVKSEALIRVENTAELNAEGSITLSSMTKQIKPMVPLVSGANFVSVKVGSAIIEILGNIIAGGSIIASAKSEVEMAADNSVVANLFIPIAVSVVVRETGILVGANSLVKSTDGSVALAADSVINVTTLATTGKIPVALAVTVIVNDVYVEVLGNIEANASVKAEANGSITTTTKALKSKTSGGNIGGFFAVAVVLQDVYSALRGSGNITAGGNVDILSTAKEIAVTNATSASASQATGNTPADTNGSATSVSSIMETIKSALGIVGDKVATGAKSKLAGVLPFLQSDDGLTISSEATSNGTVTAPAKGVAGEAVTVKVQPSKGYVLEALTYTYLPAGEKAYKTNTIDISKGGNSFTFMMPEAKVSLVAVFRKLQANETDPDLGDLFDEDNDSSLGIEDTLNEGAGSSQEASDPSNRPEPGSTGAHQITFKDNAGGMLLTDVTSADAGKEILITVNPAKGYQLKANSLKATVQIDETTKTIMTITPNASGEYLFTMLAGSVQFEALFEQATAQQTTQNNSASSQVTGAFAVTVANNKNKAYVDTSGSIIAGGKVTIKADALSDLKTEADGSQVGSEAGAAETKPDVPATDIDEITYGQNKGIVTVEATTNGKIEVLSPTNPAIDSEVILQVTPRQGFILDEASFKATMTYTSDEGVQTIIFDLTNLDYQLIGLGDGKYKFVIKLKDGNVLGADTRVSVAASFNEVLHEITVTSPGNVAKVDKVKAREGEKVTITVTPQEGKALKVSGATIAEEEDGTYSFIMGAADVALNITFADKEFNLVTDNQTNIKLSDTKADKNEKVILQLSEAALTNGVAIKSVTVRIGSEEITVTNDGDGYSFIVPDKEYADKTINITVDFDNKEGGYKVTLNTMNGGTVQTATTVKSGEKMYFRVTPTGNNKLKKNSLKVQVIDGSVTSIIIVEKDASGNYTYQLPTITAADATITVFAEFVNDPYANGKRPVSLGLGVAVGITNHNNSAYIKNGQIQAGGLQVVATSGNEGAKVNSSVITKGGYSDGNVGIGGAVSVHVATAKTKALIGSKANILLRTGELTVTATTVDNFVTKAEASPEAGSSAGNVGVGAGIAVGVIGVDVIAAIEKDSQITQSENSELKSITIEALHTGSEIVSAKAGSAGGVSVTPALTLSVSGVYTEAYFGEKAQSKPLYVLEDVKVQAKNNMTRQMAADAAAAGQSVAVGGAFGISVLNDSAKSSLRRSITTKGNVKVESSSKSSLKSTVRAGAKGAASSGSSASTGSTPPSSGSDDGEPAQQGAQADAQADKSIKAGSNLAGSVGSKNTNTSSVNTMAKDRQGAQTSEGSVSVAAGFALNIQNNQAEAYIGGDVVIRAREVAVLSYNETDAAISANGSATQSKTGVGVAIAINIVSYANLAYVDQAGVVADKLTIAALMIPSKPKDPATKPSTANPLEEAINEAVSGLLNELAKEMGLADLFGEGAVEAFNQVIADVLGEIIADTAKILLSGTGLDKLLTGKLDTIITEKLANLKTEMTPVLLTAVKNVILSKVATQLNSLYSSFFAGKSEITSDGNADGSAQQKIDTLAANEKTTIDNAINSIVNQLLKDIIDVNQLRTFLQGNVAEALKANAQKALANVGKVLTTAALDALSNWLGCAVVVKDNGPAHNIVTQAIAGAGASNVGIAGSVAIAVINGNTKAYISDIKAADQGKYPIDISGDVVIEAKSTQEEDTTATSAVDANGNPDKNLPAAADTDLGDGSAGGVEDKAETQTDKVITIDPNLTDGTIRFTKKGNTIELTVTPKAGYKIVANSVKATRSGAGSSPIKIVVLGGTYNFNLPKDLADGETITVTARFERIDDFDVTTEDSTHIRIEKPNPDKKVQVGEKVLIHVTPDQGKKVTSVTATGTNINLTLTLENANTNTYSFYMPAENVVIKATFTDGTQQPVNSSGNSVGVGAAFAFTYSDASTIAYIGKNRRVNAGTVDMQANGVHDAETISVAGTDPIGTKPTGGKSMDVALDASAAVAVLYNTVKVYVDEGVLLTTTGSDTIIVQEKTDLLDEIKANLRMQASQSGKTLTQASGFSVGGETSVGAAVTVLVVDSDVAVDFLGSGAINGKSYIVAHTYNEDNSLAIATAMGADMKRYTDKFNKGVSDVETAANGVTDGSAFNNASGNNGNNNTASNINKGLDKNQNNEHGKDSQQANNNLPLSQNALRTQNVQTESTDRTNSTTSTGQNAVNKNVDSADGNAVSGNSGTTSKSSVQVAAAVAVNITNHMAKVNLLGLLTTKGLYLLADNDGNFRTMGTGAAVSLAQNSNAIAAGVAVSVNKNQAKVTIGNNIVSEDEDIFIEASLSQNMDGKYRGYLGAQAIAGSTSGSGGNASIAGAVAIIVSRAETEVTVKEGVELTGKDIVIQASDKSKLAVRAGAVSISKGSKVGMGASFALVYAHNTVIAEIKNNVTIHANNFTLSAMKKRVDFSDYQSSLGMDNLLTDSTNVKPGETYTPGLVDMKKTGSGENEGYTISINISTASLLNTLDLLNFLSSTNYYAEAIAGAINGSGSKATIGGAIAMIFLYNKTKAILGSGVVINASRDVKVAAEEDTTVRIIAGALSASDSKVGVGVTIGFLLDDSEVAAEVNAQEITGVNYRQVAKGNKETLVITVAAVGTATGNSFGGAIDAIASNNKVSATVGPKTSISVIGDVDILALLDTFLMLGSFSVSGSGGSVAAGGTVAVIVTNNKVLSEIGEGATITSTHGSVNIKAASKESLVSALAALSASTGKGVAGTLSVLVANSQVKAELKDGVTIEALKDVAIVASGDTWMLIPAMAVAISGDMAVGATVSVNVFSQKVSTLVGNKVNITATKGNVLIEATGQNFVLMITVALGAAGNGAISGCIPVIVGESTIITEIGRAIDKRSSDDKVVISAGDSLGILSNLDTKAYLIASGLAGAGSNSVGATISTTVLRNTVKTMVLDFAELMAGFASVETPSGIFVWKDGNRNLRRSGIVIGAYAYDDIVKVSVAGTAAGNLAFSGVVDTLVVSNKTLATVGKNVTMGTIREAESPGSDVGGSGEDDSSKDSEEDPAEGIFVEAINDSLIIDLAGSIAASGNIGAGVTVVVLVFNKETAATVGTGGIIDTDYSVVVRGRAKDNLYLLAVTFAAGGNTAVAGGVNTLVFKNATKASLGGTVTAGRVVIVSATSDSTLVNVAGTGSIGGNAAVSAVAVITYFYNETVAFVESKSKITAGKDIRIIAHSKEFVTADAAAVGVAATVGVSGAVDVIIVKVITKAYTLDGVQLKSSNGNITISAKDDYQVLAIVVTLGAGGVVGVSVTALVSLSFNTVLAEIGTNNTIEALKGKVSVIAESDRNIDSYVATISGSGTAGVGVSITVVVAGSKMNQDAADSLGEGMNPQTQVDESFSKGNSKVITSDMKPEDDLNDLLEGDEESVKELDGGKYNEYGQPEKENTSDKMNDTTYDNTADGIKREIPTDIKDSTIARVSTGSTVKAVDIEVNALDNLSANMISGTASVGGAAGVGVGLSVAVLFSQVKAIVESGTTLEATGKITVKATAGAPEKAITKDSDRDAANTLLQSKVEGVNKTKSTIRLISITASGGFASVGVATAVLLVFSDVEALLSGKINKAKEVLVEASMNYDHILAVTLAVGGGAVGVNASVAFVYFQGKVVAKITDTANLQEITDSVEVKTSGQTNAIAAASAFSAGGVGVSAGVAIVVNRMDIETAITQGATIVGAINETTKNTDLLVNVHSDFTTNASVYIIGVALGGVAVNGTVAIIISSASSQTYIGAADSQEGNVTTIGKIVAKEVKVNGQLNSEVKVIGLNVAAGIITVNGAVALAFNRLNNVAAIRRINVQAEKITVLANIAGNTSVSVSSITGGAIAIGAIVALGQIKSVNRSEIDFSNVRIEAQEITVSAGTADKPYESEALVTIIAGGAGALAVALNFAIALNQSENYGRVYGDNGTLVADKLQVSADGKTRAYATAIVATLAGVAANVTMAYAKILSKQEAKVSGSGSYQLGALTVYSYQNKDEPQEKPMSIEVGVNDKTGTLGLKCSVKYTALAQAYIFNAAAGFAAGGINTAWALANASSKAVVDANDLEMKAKAGAQLGDIIVKSDGKSIAKAIVDSVTLAVASVGILVAYADAEGVFEASLATDGELEARDITVQVDYVSQAEATLTPSLGGIKVDLVGVEGNTAIAQVKTKANAFISGSGIVKARDVVVKSTGKVISTATVNGADISVSGVKVAVNIAYAKIDAQQSSYIKNVTLYANQVTVVAEYNYDPAKKETYQNKELPTIDEDLGAIAKVGANRAENSTALSFYGINTNVAEASSRAIVKSYIKNANVYATGKIDVKTLATSYADAASLETTISAGAANATFNVIEANAAGKYEAYITGDIDNVITAKSIDVYVGYNTLAKAVTGPSGDVSASINLVSVKANLANAQTSSNSKAYISSSGQIIVTDDINVIVYGTSSAIATVKTPDFSFGIANLAASHVDANVSTEQMAYLSGGADEEHRIKAGNINIISEYITKDNKGAYAAVGNIGSSTGGLKISIVEGTLNKATATSKHSNTAYIGGHVYATGNIVVRAKSQTMAKAEAQKGTSVAAVALAGMFAESTTKDSINACVKEGAHIEADGNITISALGNTRSEVIYEEQFSFGLLDANVGMFVVRVGNSTLSPQMVQVQIEKGAYLYAKGNIDIKAENKGYVTGIYKMGTDVSLVGAGSAHLKTYSYYKTQILIGENSTIISGANITILAKDEFEAVAVIDGTNVGILVSADSKYTKNEANSVVYIEVGENAEIAAKGSLKLATDSTAIMRSKNNANSGGIFDGGMLQAYNKLTRNIKIEIKDGAVLSADFGNLTILATGGENDYITTCAVGTSAGLVTISNAKATTTLNSDVLVKIGYGVVIKNIFNNVYITAQNGFGYVETIGDYGSGAFSSNPRVKSYDTEVTLNANVKIASEGVGSKQTEITGGNVYINASLGKLYLKAYTYAVTKGFHASAVAESKIDLNGNFSIAIGNAHIKSYGKLEIIASASPKNNETNVYVYSGTKIVSAIGKITSKSYLTGAVNTNVTLGATTKITGANVIIKAERWSATVVVKAHGERKSIALKSTEAKNELSSSNQVTVNSGVIFHIAEAAAGIAVDFYMIGDQVYMRSVGISREALGFSTDSSGDIIIKGVIQNNRPGYLYVAGTINGATVYGQEYIQEVIITNNTNKNLVLEGGVEVYNTDYTLSAINVYGQYLDKRRVSPDSHPVIRIVSSESADVSIHGLIKNERGEVLIKWAEDKSGNLYTSKSLVGGVMLPSLWVHRLVVENVCNIGTSISKRFEVLISVCDGNNGSVDITGNGDFFIDMRLAEITAVEKLEEITDTTIAGTLDIEEISTTGEVNDILISKSILLNYIKGLGGLSVVIPGVVEYIRKNQYDGSATLTLKDLEKYATGESPSDNATIYTLPNGDSIYIKDNAVIRVLSGENDAYDFLVYTYDKETNSIIFTDFKIAIDLATGRIYVPKDDSNEEASNHTDIYIDGDTINSENSSVEKRQEVTIYMKKWNEKNQAYEIVDVFAYTLERWKTEDDVTWYFLSYDGTKMNNTSTGEVGYVIGVKDDTKRKDENGNYIDGSEEFAGVRKVMRIVQIDNTTSSVPGVTATQDSIVYGTAVWKEKKDNRDNDGDGTVVETYERTDTYIYYRDVVSEKTINGYQIIVTFRYEYRWNRTFRYTETKTYEANAQQGPTLKSLEEEITPDASKITYYSVAVKSNKVMFKGQEIDPSSVSGQSGYFHLSSVSELRGVMWKPELDNNNGKVTYYFLSTSTISKTEISVTEEGEDPYSYEAYRQNQADTSQGMDNSAWEVVEETAYYLQVTSKSGINYPKTIDLIKQKDTGIILGGTVRLEAGESAQLIEDSNGNYYINEFLKVSGTGLLIFAAHDGKAGYEYNVVTGYFKKAGLEISGKGEAMTVTISGKLFFEKVSAEIARDAAGNFYYLNGTSWQLMTNTGDDYLHNGKKKLAVTTEATGTIKYYFYDEGLWVMSDGSFGYTTSQADQVKVKDIGGISYNLDLIKSGGNVFLRMLDSEGSIIDNNDIGDIKNNNIVAGGNITIYAENATALGALKGSIGTADNPLEFSAKEVIYIKSLDNENTIKKDIYITIIDGEGDYNFGDKTTIEDCTVVIRVENGDITANELIVNNSNVSLTTESLDIKFNLITGAKSQITLDAGRHILKLREDEETNYIILDKDNTEDNSKLTLSAGKGNVVDGKCAGNIGTASDYLVVDIPEATALYIDRVTDYYIQGRDTTLVPPAIIEGVDQDGKEEQGDFLQWIKDQDIFVPTEYQTAEEIARWIITSVKTNQEWTELLDQDKLIELIKDGVITADELAKLLDDSEHWSEEQIQAIIDKEVNPQPGDAGDDSGEDDGEDEPGEEEGEPEPEDTRTIAEIVEALIQAFEYVEPEDQEEQGDTEQEDEEQDDKRKALDEDTLTAWLGKLLDNACIEETELGDLLSSLLTEEEIKEMIDKGFAGRDPHPVIPDEVAMYVDEPARTLTIDVQNSNGSAYVKNEGNITITQHGGDVTIGEIISERGDVDITSAGSIFAGEKLGDMHVRGRNITLTAEDHIGSPDKSILIEETANRPVILARVEEDKMAIAITQDTGEKHYKLELHTFTDEDGKEYTAWVLKVVVSYDFARVDYDLEATRVSAIAKTGNVVLEEISGSMGLGVIEAGKDVVLVAPQDLIDSRTEAQIEAGKNNVTAGENASLVAKEGLIGTLETPVTVAVTGTLTTEATGTTVIEADGDLTLIVEVEDGELYVVAEDNLTISNKADRENTSNDLLLGYAVAGKTLRITALGTIIQGDRRGYDTNVIADSIELIALDGSLGSEDEYFLVDTKNGKTGDGYLSAKGENLFLREVSDGVAIGKLEATGDVFLEATGSITEYGDNKALEEATEAWKEADKAENEADEAEAIADVLEEHAKEKQAYSDKMQELLREADEKVQKALLALGEINDSVQAISTESQAVEAELLELEEELNNLDENDPEYEAKLKAIEDKIAEAVEQLTQLLTELEELEKLALAATSSLIAEKEAFDLQQEKTNQAKEEARIADENAARQRSIADGLRSAAEQARLDAEALREPADKQEAAINAGGDVNLATDGAIGTTDNALSVNVEGTLKAIAEKDIYLGSKADLTIAGIETKGDTRIDAMGNIINGLDNKSPVIISEETELNAIGGGSVGQKDKPIILDTDSVSGRGQDFYVSIIGDGDITLGNITADGEAVIIGGGNITPKDPNVVIAAEDLVIKTGGNIGDNTQADGRLTINSDNVTLVGMDITIDNISKDLNIIEITGKDVDITASGTVNTDPSGKGITADNLVIEALGSIGKEENPLNIFVTGNYDLNSIYGHVYFNNRYRKDVPTEPEEKETMKPSGGRGSVRGIGVRTGDVQELNLWMVLMILAAMVLAKKRKRSEVR
ncbi:hypothetical protein M2149_002167 [Lachnospiraceae bacterium PFB1-21]